MGASQRISAIEVQKKNTGRYSVFLDGEFAFGIDQDVLLKSGIARGDMLDEEQIREILEMEEKHRARQKALRLLSVRAQSTHELRERLTRDQVPSAIVDWVLSEMDRLKLLDDAEFARMFARQRLLTRPEGRFLLHRELKQKGIRDDQIEDALKAAYTEQDEMTLALNLARKKKNQVRHLEEIKARKRVLDLLARRGFAWNMIQEIMDQWNSL
jgi:regulatory protein